MSKIKRNPAAVKIANEILKEYDCDSLADMQDALKEIFGPLFEGMLQGEMDNHLGYKSNSKEPKSTKNRRNGSNPKTLKTTMGEVEINAPRDRNGSFEPVIVPKRSKDVSDIEGKVLSMYARGMSQRDISSTIEDIYGFKVSHDMIVYCNLKLINFWTNRNSKLTSFFIMLLYGFYNQKEAKKGDENHYAKV
ncbi:transposase [Absicoccus porci]